MEVANKIIGNNQKKILSFILLFSVSIISYCNVPNDTTPNISIKMDNEFNVEIVFENKTKYTFIQNRQFGVLPFSENYRLNFEFFICNKQDSIIRLIHPSPHWHIWDLIQPRAEIIYPDSVMSICFNALFVKGLEEIDFEKEKLLITIRSRTDIVNPIISGVRFKKYIYIDGFDVFYKEE